MATHFCMTSPCRVCTGPYMVVSVPMTSTTWNGPTCHVCGHGYLGICQRDHKPYIDTGYSGRHRGAPPEQTPWHETLLHQMVIGQR